MAPPRTGNVEPLRRANGATYFRARIRLFDGSRERVNVPPAGVKTARERAEALLGTIGPRLGQVQKTLLPEREKQRPQRDSNPR